MGEKTGRVSVTRVVRNTENVITKSVIEECHYWSKTRRCRTVRGATAWHSLRKKAVGASLHHRPPLQALRPQGRLHGLPIASLTAVHLSKPLIYRRRLSAAGVGGRARAGAPRNAATLGRLFRRSPATPLLTRTCQRARRARRLPASSPRVAGEES